MNLLPILKNKAIINKLFFTFIVLLCFRAVAAIPIPGIPQSALKDILSGSSFFQVIGLLSGGLLESIGILTIGLGPYINASYIFQLMSVVVPQIRELYQGERRMLTMYTRLLTIPLAIVQSLVIYSLLNRLGLLGVQPDQFQIIATVTLLTFGAMFSMWLGELLTEYGLGGGTSMIILAGILVSLPKSIESNLLSISNDWSKVTVVAMFILVIVIAIVITLSARKINLIYARRVRPSGNAGYMNFIPININPAGVMPVIFAISMMDLPRLGFTYLAQQTTDQTLLQMANNVIGFYNDPFWFNVVLLVVTIVFAFISAFIIFRPKEVAENINKQGAYIEGVRPGKATEQFLSQTLLYTTIYGAIFLGILTLLPTVVLNVFSLPQLVITGTGALILSSVILDIIRQIQALHAARQDNIDYY
jgi:preprotein translocase subunit SecY